MSLLCSKPCKASHLIRGTIQTPHHGLWGLNPTGSPATFLMWYPITLWTATVEFLLSLECTKQAPWGLCTCCSHLSSRNPHSWFPISFRSLSNVTLPKSSSLTPYLQEGPLITLYSPSLCFGFLYGIYYYQTWHKYLIIYLFIVHLPPQESKLLDNRDIAFFIYIPNA